MDWTAFDPLISSVLKKPQSDGTAGLVNVDGVSFLRHFNGALHHKVAKCKKTEANIA